MKHSPIHIAAWLTVAAIAVPAAQTAQTDKPAKPTNASQSSNSQTTRLASADTSFIRTAGQSGQMEVELAKVARDKAENGAVKSFAEHLQADHEQANSELTTLAGSKNVTVPEMSPSETSTRMRLDGLGGAEYDRAFVAQMIADHRAAINVFTKASNSADPDIKAFATKTLPALKGHLQQAEDLQKTLASSKK